MKQVYESQKMLVDLILFHTVCPAGICMTEAEMIMSNIIDHHYVEEEMIDNQ